MTSAERTVEDFGSFMAAHERALLRFATALTGDPRLAEDVVADVLGRAYERWSRVGSVADPLAYVRRMIVNHFVSFKRREKRAHLRLVEVGTAPDHAGAQAERDALRQRLARLPSRQRAAIVLRYYEDLPDDQIAATLGCAVGTVRSLISRALAALRVQETDIDGGSR